MGTNGDIRLQTARSLIDGFAERTGVTSDEPSVRYLWTDAFAVFAMVELARQIDSPVYLDRAKRLVDLVHRDLGRHRDDDPRTGWISGLSDSDGELHPTRGGLRIGKPLNERSPDDAYNDALEWERDGQYYHYLTKWMHALNRLSIATGEPRYNEWAAELAQAAHRGFVTHLSDVGPPHMHWKMSIDLSRPLVSPMGQLDPLDGFVTMNVLRSTTSDGAELRNGFFDHATNELAAICSGMRWVTGDPLGIGGLLMDATLLLQLVAQGRVAHPAILDEVLEDTTQCLRVYSRYDDSAAEGSGRIAFRDLGLAIGVHGTGVMRRAMRTNSERFKHRDLITQYVDALAEFGSLGAPIERRWLEERIWETDAWREHLEINTVMLASCLVPGSCLVLEPPTSSVEPTEGASSSYRPQKEKA